MTRKFTAVDYIGMVIFTLLAFPVAIWIYLNPRSLVCQSCGAELNQGPA